MSRRPLVVLALLVVCAAGSGCLGHVTDSPTSATDSTTTDVTTETTMSSQKGDETTSVPTSSTTTEKRELTRHPHVVVVEASPHANVTHNVTVRLRPSQGTAFNETAAVEPGGGFTIDRKDGNYRVTIVVNGRTVLENSTIESYEAVYVEIKADGEVAMALSQV